MGLHEKLYERSPALIYIFRALSIFESCRQRASRPDTLHFVPWGRMEWPLLKKEIGKPVWHKRGTETAPPGGGTAPTWHRSGTGVALGRGTSVAPA